MKPKSIRFGHSRSVLFGLVVLTPSLFGEESGSQATIWPVLPIGYVNTEHPEGHALIANPLFDETGRVDKLWPPPADGTRLTKFDGQSWLTNEFHQGAWMMPEMTLSPGEAAVLFNPEQRVHTWVGALPQGDLQVFIPAGLSLRSSLVPQAGKLSETLEFPKVAGTRILRVDDSGELVLWATCTGTGWEPEEPVLQVGEGFGVEAPHEFIWTRSFKLNGEPTEPGTIRIVEQPQTQAAQPGETVTFSISVESDHSVSYEWQRNGNTVAGATGPTLVIAAADSEHAGDYWVRVWDGRSWVWSDLVQLQLSAAKGPRLAIERDDAGRGMRLTLTGVAGLNITIQTSSDLRNWVALAEAEVIEDGSVLDRSADPSAARFYRLRID